MHRAQDPTHMGKGLMGSAPLFCVVHLAGFWRTRGKKEKAGISKKKKIKQFSPGWPAQSPKVFSVCVARQPCLES